MLGHTTAYTYDALNRLTTATYTNGSYVSYRYDAGGNITQIISATRHGHDSSDKEKNDSDRDGLTDERHERNSDIPNNAIADNSANGNKNGNANCQEHQAQTSSRLDTDNDGMFDSDESKYKTNPKDNTDCPA
jgi:YD repeat-containing protein